MKPPYIDPMNLMKLNAARGIIKDNYNLPTVEQYNRAIAQKSYAGSPIEVRELPKYEMPPAPPRVAKAAAPKVKPGQINLKKEINKKIIFTPAPKKAKVVKRAAAPKTKAKAAPKKKVAPTPKKKVVKNIKKIILKKKVAPAAKKKTTKKIVKAKAAPKKVSKKKNKR